MTDIDASAIAPDTRGMNFFRDDPALQDLLALYLPEALFAHLAPHLDRLGELAAGELDECAALADRHPPRLHPRDRFGRDRQWIEYHPAYASNRWHTASSAFTR
jgi:acyl-CoA dehydrogenase